MTAATTTRKPLVDPAEVVRVLRLILEHGQVTELRALDATITGDRWPTVYSGYFDDPEKLVKELQRLRTAKGVYITPNPVNPSLLARAANRLRKAPKGESVSDPDITCRRWLLIDIDPGLPAGISATDAEHEATLELARKISASLRFVHNWPDPILADSGNGAHLMYRIDLPTDDGGLVQRCLAALAKEYPGVDDGVFNPARIWKLYGSLACKGDDTPDRPHRPAQILSARDTLEIVSRELLEALAAGAPREEPKRQARHEGNGQPFDIAGFIQQYTLDVDGPHPWNGKQGAGQRWAFRTAVMCEHTDSAFIIQHGGGAISAGCHHNHCGWDWAELREKLEPKATRYAKATVDSNGQDAASPRNDEDDLPVDDPWPEPMAQEAYHGLAGEIVQAIEPHSEADPVALLAQALVGFGNLIGRTAHFVAEADTHYANLFGCLVGASSKARKGSSWGHPAKLLYAVDSEWRSRVLGGMSSGEGLIWAVRDPIYRVERDRKTGACSEVLADPGVSDKRLTALETEFGSLLTVMARERNTLSAVMRQAWDTGELRSLTKNSPAKATGAHISIIGHCTRDEVRKLIGETSLCNGFANRFLWLAVRRSKTLPDGGQMHMVDVAPLVNRLREAVRFAYSVGLIQRDDTAREVWHAVYPTLSEGKPGLLGAVTSRAEAQTMRMAMVYAVLDCSPVIRAEHLLAALAVWQYAEDSARYVFGELLGDPTADAILAALRSAPDGLTRTDIHRGVFQGNTSRGEIAKALASLLACGLVKREIRETGGRPAEVWYAAGLKT